MNNKNAQYRFPSLPGFLPMIFAAVLALGLLGACATPPSDPDALAEYNETNDPGETINRSIFEFNQALDKSVIKPLAAGWREVAPVPVQNGVHNFLNNLRAPVIFINDVLQFEFERAMTTLTRFLVNTSFGVLGFSDPATEFGLPYHSEDFGQTLAVWGFGEGPYIMLPIFGPSNPRDTIGLVVDTLTDPFNTMVDNTGNEWAQPTRDGARAVDIRAYYYDELEELEKSSLDYYAAIRSLYRQRRASEVNNGANSSDMPAPGIGMDSGPSLSGDEISTSN